MIVENSLLFKEINPNKKTPRWANQCIQLLRRNWVPLKDWNTSRENKKIIFAQQDMTPIIKSFKDKDFIKNTKFVPLAAWPRILNVIVEEILKSPPKVELRANDNLALEDKDFDKRLLVDKIRHEQIMTDENEKIGEPPHIIEDKNFKTNIREFYRTGLNPADPEDVDFYFNNDFPRLKYEIAGQKIIDEVMKLNRFDKELIRDGVLDIAADLCFCVQAYVNQVTGEIMYDHIYPEEAYGVWGNKRDGSNDVGQGWVKNQTVREWLGRVGNDFSFENDWMQLLWAINYTNRTAYTGFRRFGNNYDCWGNQSLMAQAPEGMYAGVSNSNLMDYSLAYTYNVYTGYMEWDSPEATATYLAEHGTGQLTSQQVDFDYFLDEKEEVKKYYKESFYQWQMYKSYFLPTSSTTQWIYNFGKLYMQQLEGAYDQYCKGTLMYYRLEGQSAAELTKPYIDFANLCFYRMKWIVYHSKPQKEQHVIEELIKVAKAMQKLYPQNASATAPTIDNILTQIIQYKRENMVDIRSFPEVEGKTYPVLTPQEGMKGGIDPLALGLQAIEQWLEMQIAEKVGLNDMRLGQIQNAREGFKKGLQETEASLNSTGYFYRILQLVNEHVAITTLNYAQDIVRFNESIPYKFLNKLLGENEFENAKLLKDFAAHRYALTIEDINGQFEKQSLLQAANIALDKKDGNGGITLDQWGIITMSADPKDGFRKLALFNYLAEKKRQQRAMQLEQQKHDNAMELQNRIDEIEKGKGDVVLRKAAIDAASAKYTADSDYKAKVAVKQMTTNAEAPKQEAKAEATKQVNENKENLKAQAPVST